MKKDKSKHEYWQSVLAEFASREQTVKEFCRSRNLAVWQFHYWKKQLTVAPAGFKQLILSADAQPSCRSICLQIGRVRIEVEKGFDADVLRQVLEILPC